ncbi:MAG: hypothetical protein HZB16_24315 [Armatimonadetes bacterium]|nr:hypothetical protein [Armatimonadota bacterium]
MALRAADLAKEEPWVMLTHVARQLAALSLPKTSRLGWLVAGLGLGVGHLLPPLAAVVWVLLLGGAAMYAGLSATEAWTKATERRTAELIGALRQSTPEAFAELAKRQGLA